MLNILLSPTYNTYIMHVTSQHKKCLQRAQNCLARVVTKSSYFARATPLLQSLHWLPIKSRIEFKVNLLTYKAVTTIQPSYLSNQLHFHHHQKALRSDTSKLLHPGPIPKRNYGCMSLSVAAPRLWNQLPAWAHLWCAVGRSFQKGFEDPSVFRPSVDPFLSRLSCARSPYATRTMRLDYDSAWSALGSHL